MGEWRASARAVRSARRYRCTVFWWDGGQWSAPWVCDHEHRTAEAAEACAAAEAERRNVNASFTPGGPGGRG